MPLCKSGIAIFVKLLLSVSLIMVRFLLRMKWLESHEFYSTAVCNIIEFMVLASYTKEFKAV
jgi:hypothetical protein